MVCAPTSTHLTFGLPVTIDVLKMVLSYKIVNVFKSGQKLLNPVVLSIFQSDKSINSNALQLRNILFIVSAEDISHPFISTEVKFEQVENI